MVEASFKQKDKSGKVRKGQERSGKVGKGQGRSGKVMEGLILTLQVIKVIGGGGWWWPVGL